VHYITFLQTSDVEDIKRELRKETETEKIKKLLVWIFGYGSIGLLVCFLSYMMLHFYCFIIRTYVGKKECLKLVEDGFVDIVVTIYSTSSDLLIKVISSFTYSYVIITL
jgi:hypothetical protein